MIVKCPQCQREYKVDERLLSPKGAMGKCKPCGIRFRIEPLGGTEEIVCPKCGFKQIGGLECQTCGVVFDKVRETREHTTSGREDPSSPEGFSPHTNDSDTSDSGLSTGTAPPSNDDAGADADFVIGKAVRFGWDTVKANLGFFLLLMVLSIVILSIPEIFKTLAGHHSLAITIVLTVISMVMQAMVTLGFIKVALKFVDGGKAAFSDLFECLPLFLDYLVADLVYGLIVFAGMILLVVPGIIWAIRFMFYPFAIVDRNMSSIKSLKFSSALSKGSKMDLFLLVLLLLLINLIGAIPLGLGLFITLPLSIVSSAYVYRKLQVRKALLPSA